MFRHVSPIILFTLVSCGADGNTVSVPVTDKHPSTTIAAAPDDLCSAINLAALEAVIGEPLSLDPIDTSLIKPTAVAEIHCGFRRAVDDAYVGGITFFTFADSASASTIFDDDVAEYGPADCWDGSPGSATEINVADRAVIMGCGFEAYALTGEHTVNIGLSPAEIDIAPAPEDLIALLADAVQLSFD